MTADRLRAAADRVAGVYTTIDPTPQDAATAALLRAVAVMYDEDMDTHGSARMLSALPIYRPALALVDVILGGTDE